MGEAVGLLAADVRPETPAAKAGLKKGDILVKFGDKDVASNPETFVEQVRAAKAGKVEVVVVRKGKKQTLSVELPEAPKAKPAKPDTAEAQERAAKRAADEARRTADQERRKADDGRRKMEEARRAERTTRQEYDGADFRTLSVTITDGKFTAKATNAGIEYQITGRLVEGKAVPEAIVVKEGSQTHKGKAISDIPENCQNALERLLKKVTPQ